MSARDISQALAAQVDQIATQLLPGGKRAGNYWQAGNITGGQGSSLYLHLAGERRGQWRDAATSQHGDLLDLIAIQGGISLSKAMVKAKELLGGDFNPGTPIEAPKPRKDTRIPAAALWERSRPITTSCGKHARAYFEARGIKLLNVEDIRVHKGAWVDVTNQDNIPKHYPIKHMPKDRRIATLPAIIAAVRDESGDLIAIHRTFLDPIEPIKAQMEKPKRALGQLTGGACWLRKSGTYLMVAEGIETALSLGYAFPEVALAAGITAHHMTEMNITSAHERILIAADNDTAGIKAAKTLEDRYSDRKIIAIIPRLKDFNDDLRADGLKIMRQAIIKEVGHNF